MSSPTFPLPDSTDREKLLVIELWGIGDLVFASGLLKEATRRFEVTLLAQAHARALFAQATPGLRILDWHAPWTAFRGKYQIWSWDWQALTRMIRELRDQHFDVAVSVRNDPRDHLLMWLAGARRRIGFPVRGSGALLTDSIVHDAGSQHRVQDWRLLADCLGLADAHNLEPVLAESRSGAAEIPRVCLHLGARIPVRRWPLASWAELVRRLRKQFRIHLTILPDLDGFGSDLAELADDFIRTIPLEELTRLLAGQDLLLCNDSAPAHLAAAVGTPVLAIFGPTDPVRFRPWGKDHHVVIRDICPHRPCFDYCKFSEPICMTQLLPDEVWPEVRDFVTERIDQRHIVCEA
jgi:ADP-heptose:LPS heptosyltransferase